VLDEKGHGTYPWKLPHNQEDLNHDHRRLYHFAVLFGR